MRPSVEPGRDAFGVEVELLALEADASLGRAFKRAHLEDYLHSLRLAEGIGHAVGHAVEQLAGLVILLCGGCLPHAKGNKQTKYFVQHSFL